MDDVHILGIGLLETQVGFQEAEAGPRGVQPREAPYLAPGLFLEGLRGEGADVRAEAVSDDVDFLGILTLCA